MQNAQSRRPRGRTEHIYVPPADFKREYRLLCEWTHIVEEQVPLNAYDRTRYLRISIGFVEGLLDRGEQSGLCPQWPPPESDLLRVAQRLQDFRLAKRLELQMASFPMSEGAWRSVDQATLMWMLECRWRALLHRCYRRPFRSALDYSAELRERVRLLIASVRDLEDMSLEKLRLSINSLRKRWNRLDLASPEVVEYVDALALVAAQYASFARDPARLDSWVWSPDKHLSPRFFRDTDLYFYEIVRSMRIERYLRSSLYVSAKLDADIAAAMPHFDDWYAHMHRTVNLDELLKAIDLRAMDSAVQLGEEEMYLRDKRGPPSAFGDEKSNGVAAAAPTPRDIVEHFRPDAAEEIDAVYDATLDEAVAKYPIDAFLEIADYLSKQYTRLSLALYCVSARGLVARWPELGDSFKRQRSPLVVRTDRDALYVYVPSAQRFYDCRGDPKRALLAWLWQAEACETMRNESLAALLCVFFRGDGKKQQQQQEAPHTTMVLL